MEKKYFFLFGILVWQKHLAPHGMNHHPECILCLFFMRRSCSPALLFFCPEQQQQLAARVTVALRKRWTAEQEVCRDLRGWSSGSLRGPLVVAAGGALTQPTLLAASASIRGREQRGLLPGPGLMTVMATESRFAETVAGRREAKISH